MPSPKNSTIRPRPTPEKPISGERKKSQGEDYLTLTGSDYQESPENIYGEIPDNTYGEMNLLKNFTTILFLEIFTIYKIAKYQANVLIYVFYVSFNFKQVLGRWWILSGISLHANTA